jgi:transcriptional regulator with XRE-family HTH domain
MQLSEYLAASKITYSEFARRCGTKHARTVERIAKGQRLPGTRMLPRIISASGGEVTANDFYPAAAE